MGFNLQLLADGMGWWLWGAGLLMTFSLATYFVPFCISILFPIQNLKEKYDAEWAVVTGGSSGIGLAVSKRLAAQGLNVVVVAVDNATLEDSLQELSDKFPTQEFRSVGVNLSVDGYLEKVEEATADLSVQVVFLNAGYIKTGFFDESTLREQQPRR